MSQMCTGMWACRGGLGQHNSGAVNELDCISLLALAFLPVLKSGLGESDWGTGPVLQRKKEEKCK